MDFARRILAPIGVSMEAGEDQHGPEERLRSTYGVMRAPPDRIMYQASAQTWVLRLRSPVPNHSDRDRGTRRARAELGAVWAQSALQLSCEYSTIAFHGKAGRRGISENPECARVG